MVSIVDHGFISDVRNRYFFLVDFFAFFAGAFFVAIIITAFLP